MNMNKNINYLFSMNYSHKQQRTGADVGGPTRPPPIFTCRNFLEPYIYPYANTSVHI